jgi:hypothetical protein
LEVTEANIHEQILLFINSTKTYTLNMNHSKKAYWVIFLPQCLNLIDGFGMFLFSFILNIQPINQPQSNMKINYIKHFTFILSLAVLFSCQSNDTTESGSAKITDFKATSHAELTKFFFDWRVFNAPILVDGVPDYTSSSIAKQKQELDIWQAKLNAFDTTGWTVPEQVDWYIVWAEMNGLDFAHRVKKPWERDPAFYVWFYPSFTDVPDREGPTIFGNIEYAYFQKPLQADDAASITQRLKTIEPLYEQAKKNLTGNARDLWVTGIRSIRGQSEDLEKMAKEVEGQYPDLALAAREAVKVSDDLANWLEEQAPNKTGYSGVGKENYTWNLNNVHLLPYTWEEQVALMERELIRAHSSLRLEEHRNRALPKIEKIDNAADYDRLFNAALDEYLAFWEREEIVPIKDYMDQALRERLGTFTVAGGLRSFFAEINYRAPIIMRTHDYHWVDLARMREEPHASPIRATPLLYNIFDSRAEGVATGMEEMMMHAGFLDKRPRERELIWVLLAQRDARGLGGLYQHGLEMTFDEATQYASKWTPWDLLPADGSTIQGEEQFYLRQPAYGTSYNMGKIEIERIIAEYARQRNGNFIMKEFMNDLNNVGMIPTSLIYWELTGDKSVLEKAIGK